MKQLKITNKITSRDSESIKLYLSEVSKIPQIDEEEEFDLATKSAQGDEVAKNKLITSNLRFVISVAKQYQNQGMSFEDLVNEGNLGLIKAAERFDEKRGFKFISYAVWWIRQSILEALTQNSRLIRIPSNQISSLQKLKRETDFFEQKFQREPTQEEMAEIMDEDVYKISNLIKHSSTHSSLDSPIESSNSENFTLMDTIVIEDNNSIDIKMEEESLKKDIKNVLETLKIKERDIICMYFGLMGKQKMTLEEIGEFYGLTRERVRQIKDKGVRILRSRSKSKILKQHLK
jgi:RNA polymerase primary sigma factor